MNKLEKTSSWNLNISAKQPSRRSRVAVSGAGQGRGHQGAARYLSSFIHTCPRQAPVNNWLRTTHCWYDQIDWPRIITSSFPGIDHKFRITRSARDLAYLLTQVGSAKSLLQCVSSRIRSSIMAQAQLPCAPRSLKIWYFRPILHQLLRRQRLI